MVLPNEQNNRAHSNRNNHKVAPISKFASVIAHDLKKSPFSNNMMDQSHANKLLTSIPSNMGMDSVKMSDNGKTRNLKANYTTYMKYADSYVLNDLSSIPSAQDTASLETYGISNSPDMVKQKGHIINFEKSREDPLNQDF